MLERLDRMVAELAGLEAYSEKARNVAALWPTLRATLQGMPEAAREAALESMEADMARVLQEAREARAEAERAQRVMAERAQRLLEEAAARFPTLAQAFPEPEAKPDPFVDGEGEVLFKGALGRVKAIRSLGDGWYLVAEGRTGKVVEFGDEGKALAWLAIQAARRQREEEAEVRSAAVAAQEAAERLHQEARRRAEEERRREEWVRADAATWMRRAATTLWHAEDETDYLQAIGLGLAGVLAAFLADMDVRLDAEPMAMEG